MITIGIISTGVGSVGVGVWSRFMPNSYVLLGACVVAVSIGLGLLTS